jgi:hypothetical protein
MKVFSEPWNVGTLEQAFKTSSLDADDVYMIV